MLKRIAVAVWFAALMSAQEPAAAVVISLEGNVTVTTGSGAAVPARVFDWLKAGTAIETGPGSHVALALGNGQRFEVQESSRATVEAQTVQEVSGTLRRLAPAPPIPRLAAIEGGPPAGGRAGAVRLRGPQIRNCYPGARASVLADQAILRFDPADEVREYLIEVEDADGASVYRTRTTAVTVPLAPGLLAPGATYLWRATGVGGEPPPRCEAEFRVVPAKDAKEREAYRAAAQQEGGVEPLLMLAELDRRMGLAFEARSGLMAVKARFPDLTAAQREVLARVEERLGQK